MNLGDLWTFVLDIIGQVIIPTWKDLIQYIPLLLMLLLIVSIGGLVWYWQRNAAQNRSRVPKPLPAGRKPDDLHLPGPSLWPFVAPIGLVPILFALAFGIGSMANLLLLALGATIGVVGLVGWYLDAKQEYVGIEAGGHAQLTAGGGSEPPGWSLQPPEGMHLPGPSAWPFLAPVGLLFMVAGMIFGPAMLIGGLIMGVIAIVGWYFDARHELDDIEAHGHPSQADRDPEKAWPRRLIPIYVLVGAVALLLTLAPAFFSLFPGGGG